MYADNVILAILTRGFFGVIHVAAAHPELKRHMADAVSVLRVLCGAYQRKGQSGMQDG